MRDIVRRTIVTTYEHSQADYSGLIGISALYESLAGEREREP